MSALRDAVGRPGTDLELSVVIAAYDAETTLGEQLDALVAQRVPFAWEVVVADNGSSDGTADLARSYAGRLRIRVVDASATPGAGAARNVGVSVARAPLIAFCDADDVVGDGWLAAMRAALGRHAFVAGRFDGTRLNSPAVLRSRTVPQQHGLQESARLPGLHAAGAGNMGIRADVFRAVGGFDPRCLYLEDADLCWRVQLAGVPLVWAPDALLHVRLRGSLWSTARQGYHYGTGERWLALRYREQDERLREIVATRVAAVGVPAAAGAPGAPQRAGGGLAGAAFTGAALGLVLTDAALAGAVVAGDLAASAALTSAGLAGARGRSAVGRTLRRVTGTAADLARVRSTGDLGRWCWDVGWGLGYAFGRVDVPEPVVVRAGALDPALLDPAAFDPAAATSAATPVPAPAPPRPEARARPPGRGAVRRRGGGERRVELVDQVPRDLQRRGGRGRRRVEHVHLAARGLHQEVVDQPAVAAQRLRAHPGRRRHQVAGGDAGHEPRQAAGERVPGQRAPDLGGAGHQVLRGEPPQARPGEAVRDVAHRHVRPGVALARQGEHGVRARVHVALDPAGQVHAEEREPRVRHGVDEAAHQLAGLRRELEVLAAERHDPGLGLEPAGARDPVGVQAGAHDQRVGLAVGAGGADLDAAGGARRVRHGARGEHLLAEQDPPARRLDVRGQRPADAGVVDDPGALHAQGRDRADVRLVLAGLLRGDPPGGDAVGHRAVGELLQAGHLGGGGGDDELAADVDRDALRPGVLRHRPGAGGGHRRLEAARGVVQAGVDDAGVAAGLVQGQAVLLLQHRDLVAPGGQARGDGQPDDPGPDDDDVAHGGLLEGRGGPARSRAGTAPAARTLAA